MTTKRSLMAGLAVAVAFVGPAHSAAAAEGEGTATVAPFQAGVRTDSPTLAALIREASNRSETFRGLVACLVQESGAFVRGTLQRRVIELRDLPPAVRIHAAVLHARRVGATAHPR